jgi:hypothetical protein
MSLNARWKLPLVIGALALGAAVLFALVQAGPGPEAVPDPEVRTAASLTPAPAAPAPLGGTAPAPHPAPGVSDPVARFLEAPAAASSEEEHQKYPVKLEEVRARLPDNLYWKRDAPTKDPEELRRRAEEEQRWNELFGKVQAGEATEEEIQRYYDYRRQLSEDYIAFASLMLTEYGDRLPERDQGLIALSIRMHRDRLAEVPRQLDEALARKRLQDQRREQWQRSGNAP